MRTAIGGTPRLDAAAPRQAKDQLAFRLRDAAFGPRHLNDRHERQQTDGLGRKAKVVQLVEELRVIEPDLAAEVLARPLGCGGLTDPNIGLRPLAHQDRGAVARTRPAASQRVGREVGSI